MKSAIRHKGSFTFDDLFSPKKTKPILSEKIYKRRNHITPVLQYTKNGELIKKWDSIIDTQKCGFNPTAIIACCKERTKSSGGYVWVYADK